MDKPLICFSHFYNEEFLLPYWLKHHTKIFDHGVLVDYCSNDRSVEIIKELAPTWEVRDSANYWFDAADNDNETMAIEKEFSGWKFALNITEFVFHPDLKEYLTMFDAKQEEAAAISMNSVVMADNIDLREEAVTDDPLFFQKFHGYIDRGQHTRRLRYIHKGDHGHYHLGRHYVSLSNVHDNDLLLLWFGWSPIKYVWNRKLQIQTRMSPRDKAGGLGFEHIQNDASLEMEYQRQAGMSSDLREDKLYADIFEKMKGRF